jgi:hypothetical protein
VLIVNATNNALMATVIQLKGASLQVLNYFKKHAILAHNYVKNRVISQSRSSVKLSIDAKEHFANAMKYARAKFAI